MMDDDTTPADPAAERLLGELQAAATAIDPVPATVIAAAEASWSWRTIDAELAELAYDSAGERELAGARGATTNSRLVTFTAAGAALEVEVEISFDRERGRMEGQLVPPAAALVHLELVSGTATLTAAADEMGRFRFDAISRGPARLRVEQEQTTVTTSWIAL